MNGETMPPKGPDAAQPRSFEPQMTSPPASFDQVAGMFRNRVLDPPTHPGQLATLDKYEILSRLGEGGMGTVFLARHPVTASRVALKLLRSDLIGEPHAHHRFVVEARHMMNMSHPHILHVMDVSDRPEGPYYTMPFMERGSLSKMIKPGQPLDYVLTTRIARQVAEALDFAHSKGIIHRDLKPANVLIDAEGRAYLGDFGLVRTIYNDSITDVRRSQCEGTAPYMSPAVAKGEAEDTRCDIYSFGAMLYEMLTGVPPYEGRTTDDVLRRVLAGPPEPIRKRNPHAPPELVLIAESAMARELRDRYAEMEDIVKDLDRVERGKQPLGPHGKEQVSHKGRYAIAASLGFLLLGTLSLLAWKATSGTSKVEEQRIFEPASRIDPKPTSPADTPKSVAPANPHAQNPSAAQPSRVSKPEPIELAALPEPVKPPDIRPTQPEPVEPAPVTPEKIDPKPVAPTPIEPTPMASVVPDTPPVVTPALPGAGPQPIALLQGHEGAVNAVAFSPDGRLLATGSYDRSVRLWDVGTGAHLATLDGHSSDVYYVGFSLDGKTLITQSKGAVKFWDVARAAELGTLKGLPAGIPSAIRMSPHGRTLAWSRGGEVYLSDVDNYIAQTPPRATLKGHRVTVYNIYFSPDGSMVATGGNDAVVKVWDVETGRELSTFAGSSAPYIFDRDKHLAVSASGSIKVWDLDSIKVVHTIPSSSKMAFSPDGALLATTGRGRERTVDLWNLAKGEVISQLSENGAASSIVFSPTGQHLAIGTADNTISIFATPK